MNEHLFQRDNEHLLQFDYAPRPFEFNDVVFDANYYSFQEPLDMESQAEVVINETEFGGDHFEFFNYGRAYGVASHEALNPWLSVADALEKGFIFNSDGIDKGFSFGDADWLLIGKWFHRSTGLPVEKEPLCYSVGYFIDGWVKQEIKEGSICELHYVAFKPIKELCSDDTLQICKRIKVWEV